MLLVNTMSVVSIVLIMGYHLIGVKDEKNDYEQL